MCKFKMLGDKCLNAFIRTHKSLIQFMDIMCMKHSLFNSKWDSCNWIYNCRKFYEQSPYNSNAEIYECEMSGEQPNFETHFTVQNALNNIQWGFPWNATIRWWTTLHVCSILHIHISAIYPKIHGFFLANANKIKIQ